MFSAHPFSPCKAGRLHLRPPDGCKGLRFSTGCPVNCPHDLHPDSLALQPQRATSSVWSLTTCSLGPNPTLHLTLVSHLPSQPSLWPLALEGWGEDGSEVRCPLGTPRQPPCKAPSFLAPKSNLPLQLKHPRDLPLLAHPQDFPRSLLEPSGL